MNTRQQGNKDLLNITNPEKLLRERCKSMNNPAENNQGWNNPEQPGNGPNPEEKQPGPKQPGTQKWCQPRKPTPSGSPRSLCTGSEQHSTGRGY